MLGQARLGWDLIQLRWRLSLLKPRGLTLRQAQGAGKWAERALRQARLRTIFHRVLPIGKINNVVGQPAEGVNGIYVLALRLGQQGSTPEVGSAVAPGQPRAAAVPLCPPMTPTRSPARLPKVCRDSVGREFAGDEHHGNADPGDRS